MAARGKFAGTLFLESDRAKAAATAKIADPELRALLDAQRVLGESGGGAAAQERSRWTRPSDERESEKLLTELALKTRAIRERENKK